MMYCLVYNLWRNGNADRNFCTAKFLFTIANQKAFFVIRQHGSLGWTYVTELKALGQTETGDIFEQEVEIYYEGNLRSLPTSRT